MSLDTLAFTTQNHETFKSGHWQMNYVNVEIHDDIS